MELLTVQEIASSLKVKPSWVYAQTRQTGPDSIPRIKCRKYLRFELHAVMDWLRKETERSLDNGV